MRKRGRLRKLLTFGMNLVARRQWQCCDVRHRLRAGAIEIRRVARVIGKRGDDQSAPQVFAQDLVRTGCFVDLCNPAERHHAGRRIEQQTLQGVRRARGFRQTHHEIVSTFTFGDLRFGRADGQLRDGVLHRCGRESVLGGGARIDMNLHLRNIDLLFDLHVGQAGDLLQPLLHLRSQTAQRRQVIADDFENQRSAHAR